MKKDESEIQMSVRMSRALNEECSRLAAEAGQTLAEWIRRAMREKADRAGDPLEARIKALEEKIEAMELYIKATQSEP